MDLLGRIKDRLRDAGLWRDTLETTETPWIQKVIELLKPRVRTLDQLVDELRPFLVNAPEIEPAAGSKHLAGPAAGPLLTRLSERLSTLEPFDPATTEQTLRSTADEAGIKAAALIHATRVAVTGRTVSAGLFDVLALLGKARVVKRLTSAATYTPGE
jgi:glutamyl-tRNA synthetase